MTGVPTRSVPSFGLCGLGCKVQVQHGKEGCSGYLASDQCSPWTSRDPLTSRYGLLITQPVSRWEMGEPARPKEGFEQGVGYAHIDTGKRVLQAATRRLQTLPRCLPARNSRLSCEQ